MSLASLPKFLKELEVDKIKQEINDDYQAQRYPREFMAKQEIKKRTANIFYIIRWKYWLKAEVSIPWPQGWTRPDHLGNSRDSSDPNDHYRPWLEQHAGPQGRSWDWMLDRNSLDEYGWNNIKIKFRDPKAATLFVLKFG